MIETSSPRRHASGDPDALPPSAVRAELERILASETLRRSPRHRSFLQFVVEHKLAGRVGRLKEIVLAVSVFGRPQARFDPQRDPIVRVEAGRLRDRLARFYATEGADSTVGIAIPKGGYLPTFVLRAPAEAAGPRATSIAVMPFVDVRSASGQEGFGDGLTDELIHALGQVEGIRIASRTSSYQFRNRTIDARGVGKALHVANIVDGSVHHQGNRLRCIANFVRTRDGFQVWSKRFDVVATDVLAAQEAIARAIVDELQSRPVADAPSRPS